MRVAVVALLALTLAFGIYLGWHFTHTGSSKPATCSHTNVYGTCTNP